MSDATLGELEYSPSTAEGTQVHSVPLETIRALQSDTLTKKLSALIELAESAIENITEHEQKVIDDIRPEFEKFGKLERELAELRAETAWRPIAEAPKDGSEILLFEKYGTAPFVGYWSPRIGRWEASTEHYSVNGDACIFTSCLQSDILHFIPLPKPPTL